MPNLLDLPFISSTRRNHALEHATIHLISRKRPGVAFAGHSNPGGFILVGDADLEMIVETVQEALGHLRAGRSSLAIHEGCGTNYALIGGLAALFSIMTLSNTNTNQQRWGRFPLLMLTSLVAFLVGRSVGPGLQKHVTTDAAPAGLHVVSVSRLFGKVHWVRTEG